jgi:molybdopterin synthase sulfur carrier subunit
MSEVSSATVLLRFFAGARAAMGTDELPVALTDATSIGGVLEALRSDDPQLQTVLGRCSFLLNGVATTDRNAKLSQGDELDVLPPFAGG